MELGGLASVLVVLFLLAGSLTALIYCRFALACCFGKLGTYLSISATAFALEARSISLLLRTRFGILHFASEAQNTSHLISVYCIHRYIRLCIIPALRQTFDSCLKQEGANNIFYAAYSYQAINHQLWLVAIHIGSERFEGRE